MNTQTLPQTRSFTATSGGASGIALAPAVKRMNPVPRGVDPADIKLKLVWRGVESISSRSAPQPRSVLQMRSPRHWGIVLAGGDGVRLRELTQYVCGDDRPKQFCPLLGERTLLEEARQRAERSLPTDQILFALTRSHHKHYLRYLADRPSQRIVQPSNKGTAPAILCSLLSIARADSNAVVSILPCDHYYSREDAFSATLEQAFDIAEQRRGSIVLLGAEANGPEIEYGWIETGESIDSHLGLSRVKAFHEKPSLPAAAALFRSGSLWNTFVMVGPVQVFLDLARNSVPSLMRELEPEFAKLDPRGEVLIPDAPYNRIHPIDFSRQILSPSNDRLLALPLERTEWSDLGDPYRVLVTFVQKNGYLPDWANLWLHEHMTRGIAVGA
ncbi:MAG TPA: sugar phosphate nucleotidyltransferase [Bryobacteraceae bacterium]